MKSARREIRRAKRAVRSTWSFVGRLFLRRVKIATRLGRGLARRTLNRLVRKFGSLWECVRLTGMALKGDGTAPAPGPSPQPTHRTYVEWPRALIISLSSVLDDPRIRRQASALEHEGWHVHLAGFEGRSAGSAKWTVIPLDRNRVRVHTRYKCLLPLSLVSRRFAETYYWQNPANVYMWDRLHQGPWDLVIANDYTTVPLAAEVSKLHGVDYVVDCHEYARQQPHLVSAKQHLLWWLFFRPYIDAIHRHFLPEARVVSTVSDGIASLLQRSYALRERPIVVRSVPEYEAHSYRPCGKTIRVLYHGGAVPSRGLEHAIDSVSLWRPEFHLVLRLVTTDTYLAFLKERVARNAVTDRVHFLEPVPFTDMISEATKADIGYHIPLNFSEQIHFSLPNKFFEYPMAGLAVVCADLPEWRKIGDEFGHCVFVNFPDPATIAEKINGLSIEMIDGMKKRALDAARYLCWENEREIMVSAYLRSSARPTT